MKLQPEPANFFIRELYFPQYIKPKITHILLSICWFLFILAGTLIVGAAASNYQIQFNYCDDSETFCTHYLTLPQQKQLFLYVKLYPVYMNNRIFLEGYSIQQLHGVIGNRDDCGDYSTYQSIDKTLNAGGYEVPPETGVHPCGFVMKSIYNDTIYLIDSLGGTPTLDQGNLVSPFYKQYHFSPLENYQNLQWVDVQDTNFINWFTISMSNTKYMLVGRHTMAAGNYQIIIRNNFLTKGQFSKTLVLSEIGTLGDANLVLGFSIFAFGILVLFIHMLFCCKDKKK